MFYRLKSGYVLRGWEEMAWVLVKQPENEIRYLTQNMFQVLLLCDGKTDLQTDLFDKTLESVLYKCLEEGIVEQCAKPCSLDTDQYYKYYRNRFIKRVFWSITGKCNFRCRHCYMDAPKGKLGELSTEEALNLIDQMAECGVLRVDITGGEPLIRKDFWSLIDKIISYKMVIRQCYTNGWLLDEKILYEFEKRKLKPEIEISFDGVGWHDWMRGVNGAEKATLRAITLCCERGFPVSVAMCIHRGNKDVLPQTIKVLHEIGVKEIRVSNVDQTELWLSSSEGYELSWREYINIMLPYISWYYEEGRPIESLILSGIARMNQKDPCEMLVRQYNGTESCVTCHLCGPTRWSCYITPEGRLLPCMPMTASPKQEFFPKVQEIGLQQGLKSSYYLQFVNSRIKDLFEANHECSECEYRFRCGGGCRAAALLDGEHELMGCDREMCSIWKNGYVDRIEKAIQEVNLKYGEQS